MVPDADDVFTKESQTLLSSGIRHFLGCRTEQTDQPALQKTPVCKMTHLVFGAPAVESKAFYLLWYFLLIYF